MSAPVAPVPARPRALIIGATAGLGRALAEAFAAAGWDLVLTGRETEDLAALASDLRLRHGAAVEAEVLDLATSARDWKLSAAGSPFNAVLIPAGTVLAEDGATLPEAAAERLWRSNFGGPTQVIARVLPHVARDGQGTIVGFGSIAATRGRTRNIHYGAAKRALEAFFEGLRHELQSAGIRVQFYIPGYLDTNLAAGAGVKLPKGNPAAFARIVLRDLHKDIGNRYFPFWWRALCVVLRLLPWAFYRRLRF